MSFAIRRACFGARRSPFSPVQSPHTLRTNRYSNQLLAFKSSFEKQRQPYNPRSFPSAEEQQQEAHEHDAGVRLYTKLKRRETLKVGLLWAIVAANTAVFAAWQYDKLPKNAYHNPTTRVIHRWMDFLASNFILSVEHVKKGYWWTIVTSEFSHKDLIHFGFNMMAFVNFGQLIVHGMPQVSPLVFGGLCLGSILSASAAFLAHHNANGDPRGGLGASGMVSGVLAAATCAFPTMQLRIFGIIPAPMWAATLGFFAIDSGMLGSGIWSPIGHDAHVGGSVFGALFYVLVMRRAKFRP